MDRPNSPGTPGCSLHSAKFMINDQTDWCRPQTCCLTTRRRSYGFSNFFAEGLEGRPLPIGEDEAGLGLENATLNPSTSSDIPSPTSSIDDVEAAATGDVASDSGSLLAGLETDHMFELRDITVRFLKHRCLSSVVTGPTTSGKTALLVRRRVPPYPPCLNRSFGT